EELGFKEGSTAGGGPRRGLAKPLDKSGGGFCELARGGGHKARPAVEVPRPAGPGEDPAFVAGRRVAESARRNGRRRRREVDVRPLLFVPGRRPGRAAVGSRAMTPSTADDQRSSSGQRKRLAAV